MAKIAFRDGGERIPSGQGVEWVERVVFHSFVQRVGDNALHRDGIAVMTGEEGDHFLDLHDLLGGAAEEAKQGFSERLSRNAQAGEGGEAAGEVGIAAPG